MEGGDPEKREGRKKEGRKESASKEAARDTEPITKDVFKKSAEMRTHDETPNAVRKFGLA